MASRHDEQFWRMLAKRTAEARMRRRQFLRYMAALGVSAASVPLLAACGDDEDDGGGSSATATTGGGSTPAAGTPAASGTTASSGSPSTGGGLANGGVVAGYDNPQKWAGKSIVVASFGGALQDAQRQAIFTRFTELTGCEVKEDASDTAKLKAMVESGAVEWDVMETGIEVIKSLSEQELIEPIDYNIVDRTGLSDEVAIEYTVGAFYWSTLLAYNTELLTTAPASWADFWNTSAFEGNRSLNNSPTANLEFALMADGVAKESVYPIDADRAYASLDKIRDAISVWWEQGAQPPQLLSDKEVSMASSWSGRIYAAQQEGAKIAPVWNQGVVTFDTWVVPKGTANKDVAMDFINFATRAEPAADLANIIPYGPINEGAFQFLSEERKQLLPSEPTFKSQQLVSDYSWWWDNYDEQDERFAEWILG